MPATDKIVASMQRFADQVRKMASEEEQAQQWRDTRFAKAVDDLSAHFIADESWDEHQLVDAFNQICDILKIKETIGGKSNSVVEIEKLPASATKQELLQASHRAYEVLDPICRAMMDLLDRDENCENCTELDIAMCETFNELQYCILILQQKLM